MDAFDKGRLEWLAVIRLSEIGYQRFVRLDNAGATPEQLKEFIYRTEARELMLANCTKAAKRIQ